MSEGIRIQLQRTKGFSLQGLSRLTNGLPCVKVDRTTKWGNPAIIGQPWEPFTAMVVDRRHAFCLYRGAAPSNQKLVHAARSELKGMNLACWCPFDDPYEDVCHAAVLLKIANS